MSLDRDPQHAALAEIGWEPRIHSAHIGVASDAGGITLTGHVQSYAQKLAADAAAAWIKVLRR